MDVVADTVKFLELLADRLDGWAADSRRGGWSTHQVQANMQTADQCRQKAGELRRYVR